MDELDEIGISLKRCETEFELLKFYEKQIKTVRTSFVRITLTNLSIWH